MWKRLSMLWALVRGDAAMVWRALRHPGAPGWLKPAVALLLLYVLSPVDLIPDVIPFAGLLDDVTLVPLALHLLLKWLPPHVRADVARRPARAPL